MKKIKPSLIIFICAVAFTAVFAQKYQYRQNDFEKNIYYAVDDGHGSFIWTRADPSFTSYCDLGDGYCYVIVKEGYKPVDGKMVPERFIVSAPKNRGIHKPFKRTIK